MKTALTILLLAAFVVPIHAQVKADPPIPAGPTEQKPIPVSDKLKLEIRDTQHDMDNLEKQNTQVQAFLAELKTKYTTDDTSLKGLVEKAWTESKLDKTKYDLDMDRLVFVVKPPPTPPAK